MCWWFKNELGSALALGITDYRHAHEIRLYWALDYVIYQHENEKFHQHSELVIPL